MPAVSNTESNNSKTLRTSSSNNCIKTISSFVSSNSLSSPSLLNIQSKQTKSLTRCPHVILIGNVSVEDLDIDYRCQIQLKKLVSFRINIC
jgi:hypothetical protein